MKRIRGKITYANVMATLAVFLVLGGGAYAATQLPKNSVGSKQLKKNAVTGAKIKKGTITGAKVKLSTLGTVPSAAAATNATNAGNASNLGGVAANRYVRPGSVLASGDSVTGVYAASGPSGIASAAINFVPKLPAPVFADHAEVLATGATSANCPGPRQALPGYFCVYTTFANSITFQAFAGTYPSAGSQVVEPEGAVLLWNVGGAGGNVRGTWAYTAP
jgi:hypothetical protein